jgi:hypothetical protein
MLIVEQLSERLCQTFAGQRPKVGQRSNVGVVVVGTAHQLILLH